MAVTLSAIAESLDETEETVTVVLLLPAGESLTALQSGEATTTVTIVDDDDAEISVQVATSADELAGAYPFVSATLSLPSP